MKKSTKVRAKSMASNSKSKYDDYDYVTNATGKEFPGSFHGKGSTDTKKKYSVPTYKMGVDKNDPEYRKAMNEADAYVRGEAGFAANTINTPKEYRNRLRPGGVLENILEAKKDAIRYEYSKKKSKKEGDGGA